MSFSGPVKENKLIRSFHTLQNNLFYYRIVHNRKCEMLRELYLQIHFSFFLYTACVVVVDAALKCLINWKQFIRLRSIINSSNHLIMQFLISFYKKWEKFYFLHFSQLKICNKFQIEHYMERGLVYTNLLFGIHIHIDTKFYSFLPAVMMRVNI